MTNSTPDAARNTRQNEMLALNRGGFVWPRDEWAICYSHRPASGDLRREYIFHIQFPRFVARVVELLKDGSGNPIAGEGDVDAETGVTYNHKNELLICEVVWLETPEAMAGEWASARKILAKAAQAAEQLVRQMHELF